MAVLWNPGGQNLILKQNMTIGYAKELDFKEKDPLEQLKNSEKITPTPPPENLLSQ